MARRSATATPKPARKTARRPPVHAAPLSTPPRCPRRPSVGAAPLSHAALPMPRCPCRAFAHPPAGGAPAGAPHRGRWPTGSAGTI